MPSQSKLNTNNRYSKYENKLKVEKDSNLVLEQSIIGNLLINNPYHIELVKSHTITVDSFYNPDLKLIFGIIENQLPSKIEHLTTTKNLALAKDISFEQASQLVFEAIANCSLANQSETLDKIAQAKAKRKLLELSELDFFSDEPNQIIDEAKFIVKEAENSFEHNNQKATTGPSLFERYAQKKEELSKMQSLSLPFQAFQKAGIVFGSTHLVTISARPKVGKTSLALQTAVHFAEIGKKVMFISLELEEHECLDKCLGILGDYNPIVAKTYLENQHKMSDSIQTRYKMSVDKLFGDLNGKLFLEADKKMSIWKICQLVRQQKKKGLEVVCIDQLSFIHTDGKFKEKHREYDYIVRELKELAKELKVCIILLSQLNRSADGRDDDDMVQLSDIKDSSSIEETSDILILLQKSKKADIEGKEIVPIKAVITSRHSRGGLVALNFNTKTTKFID
jgi:replicative DNA helicase